MTELTPLMVSSAPLLRAIAAGGDLSPKALAGASGRKRNNMSRDLATLEKQAWIIREPGAEPALTDTGRQVLAMLDPDHHALGNVEQPTAATLPQGYLDLPYRLIIPSELNPREHFDQEELCELANSIARDGLLENLVVRRHPLGTNLITAGEGGAEVLEPLYVIVAGERRWRAISILIADDRWRYDVRLLCKVADIDDAAHRRIALIENLQRSQLRPIEEAKALKELMDLEGKDTAEIGEELSRSRRWVQQRLQFLELPEDKQTALNSGELSVREARDWLQNRPKPADLSDEQWLILLEIHDRTQRFPVPDATGQTYCGAEALGDERLAGWNNYPKYYLSGPYSLFRSGFDTGLFKIGLQSYGGLTQLRLKFGEEAISEAGMPATLMAARQLVDPDAAARLGPDDYLIPWLQGPFEPPADLQERIAAAAQAERDRNAAWKRQHEEAAAQRTREIEIRAAAKAKARIFAEGRAETEPAETIAELALAAGAPLPWRWQEESKYDNGGIVDANGEFVNLDNYDGGEILQYVVVALLNSAAGHKTEFVAEPDEDDDASEGEPNGADPPPSRAAFINLVTDQLLEAGDLGYDLDKLTDAAEAGLDAFLQQESIEYGDAEYDWEADGASQLAALIRLDDLGQQIDLEEAIGEAAKDEIPDALRKLAGPGASLQTTDQEADA